MKQWHSRLKVEQGYRKFQVDPSFRCSVGIYNEQKDLVIFTGETRFYISPDVRNWCEGISSIEPGQVRYILILTNREGGYYRLSCKMNAPDKELEDMFIPGRRIHLDRLMGLLETENDFYIYNGYSTPSFTPIMYLLKQEPKK